MHLVDLSPYLAQRDKFQRDFGIVRQTQLNIEEKLEELSRQHKEHSGYLRKVEAEADNLVAKLKVDFGRSEEALPKEEELVGQSADDHVYKVGREDGDGRVSCGQGREGLLRSDGRYSDECLSSDIQ